ncbi:MAG: DUF2225 domain-containing protein [Symbiobacteriaceae bacterium]|nr:DUF2225 domain-containing protein [Symbiobacteriaceae bacterium]
MSETEKTYSKTVNCPHCSKSFNVLRVKTRFFKVLQRFRDFGATYVDNFSPYLFEIVVCPFCGFAWDIDSDIMLMPAHRERLKPILSRWNIEDMNSQMRTSEHAIHAYMWAILCDQTRKAKNSALARKHLHLAWIYRGLGDTANEQRFLVAARDGYRLALSSEDLWSEHNGSEILATYMAAVLSHMVGDNDGCTRWLSQVIFNHPEADQRPIVVNMAKELWSDIRHADWKSSIVEIQKLATEKAVP